MIDALMNESVLSFKEKKQHLGLPTVKLPASTRIHFRLPR